MKKLLIIFAFVIFIFGCSIYENAIESKTDSTLSIEKQSTSFIGIPIGSNYELMVNSMNVVFPFIEQVWTMGHPNKLFSQVDIGDFIVTKEIVDDKTGFPKLIEGISEQGDRYKIEFTKNEEGNDKRAEFILYVNGEKEYGIMEILKTTPKKVFLRSIIKYYPNENYNVRIDVDFPEPTDIQYIGKEFEVRVEVFGKTFKETMWAGKTHSDLVDSLTLFLENQNIEPVEEHMEFAQTLDPYLLSGVETWSMLASQIPDSVVVENIKPEDLNTLGTILADYWTVFTTAAYFLVSKLVGG